MQHPEVGAVELSFEVLTPPDESGHRILLYTPEPGSPAEGALELLRRNNERTISADHRTSLTSDTKPLNQALIRSISQWVSS